MSERALVPEPPAEDRTYNGWANYPTWAAYSWLSNDEESYRATGEIVAGAGNEYRGADELQAWVEGNSPLADEASLYADILGWAIQAIAWEEVARAFRPEEGQAGEPT